jgi:TPP-dependent pyruvate/acetoin dehydrogenase alpha subunit
MLAGFVKQGDVALQTRLYRSLYRIRRAEEEIARVYPTDKIKSPVHLSIGQEGVAVGVCEALEPHDVVFGSYRGHAMYLAKGGELKRMIAELYGKVDGCARGKGGSMHLVDVARGVMGTSAVVATTIPNAVGYAYAIKLRREPRIVVSFLGDGATEEGVFAESLNFAALKKLPILFVCENNRYAIHTHQQKRQANDDIGGRVKSHGVPAHRIEQNDVLALHSLCTDLVAKTRNGGGPAFVECMTYRWLEHVGPGEDFGLGFRERAEADTWKDSDPVKTIGARLEAAARGQVEKEVEAELRAAFDYAESSAFPGPEELHRHVFR